MNEEIEFTSKNLHALLCILLKVVGGISISKKKLDEFPEGVKWQASYDETNERWLIFIPKKRKRKIITPIRKLVLPN